MKKLTYSFYLPLTLFVLLTLACSKQTYTAAKNKSNDSTYILPLAGNAFITSKESGTSEQINNNGLANWSNKNTVISSYIRVNKAGTIKLGLNAKVLPDGNSSQVKVTVNGNSKTLDLKNSEINEYPIGDFTVDTGYVKIDLQGIDKSGAYFADVTSYTITGDAVSNGVTYSNDPEFYYWARRGPSCHLAYTVPTTEKVNYYYSEIEVPQGSDPHGSYFMANGFGEGYFGFQVNSDTERRILFSVWSPYNTDDPNSIPDDQKIILNKKGPEVQTGEFGNEGSGGQSFLRYNWKAGTTYKFLLKGEPDGTGKTDYTAWFYAPEQGQWRLIASFKRPKTDKYLTNFHSFLENFNPNQGHLARTADYKNQWVRTTSGNWEKVSEAKFTVDNTYRSKQRIDAIGGKNNNGYFLKNGGFFSELVTPGTKFNFDNISHAPQIDFNSLP